jgi:hypothetical protein
LFAHGSHGDSIRGATQLMIGGKRLSATAKTSGVSEANANHSATGTSNSRRRSQPSMLRTTIVTGRTSSPHQTFCALAGLCPEQVHLATSAKVNPVRELATLPRAAQ